MDQGSLEYAVLGIVSSREAGIHGYQLKTEFDSLYAGFWAVNFGQLYRALDRLERQGRVVSCDEQQSKRPNRKVYRLTGEGKKSLDDWLQLPPSDVRLALRDELMVKLCSAAPARGRDVILALVSSQRALYLQSLARVKQRTKEIEEGRNTFSVTRLLLAQADLRVRADLVWLDVVEKEIQQHFPARKSR